MRSENHVGCFIYNLYHGDNPSMLVTDL